MCGVSGLWNWNGVPMANKNAGRLLEALQHRGPDGEGVLALPLNGNPILGRNLKDVPERDDYLGLLLHRRLSIVDVAGGAQPICNEDGTVWLTFNGEIYNHLDLRHDLERLGHRFATRADTEVIVHGWEEWGTDLLPRLNGIYAFGIVDRRREPQLWLARDPAGVKPLYVGCSAGTWWFASEIEAARSAGLVGADICQQALAEFLVYRFVPSPRTIYKGAWKLPPGHCCRIEGAASTSPDFRPFSYRRLHSTWPKTQGEWEETLASELEAAVRRQLMSDVPVGTLLSGGVDSSVVTQVMRDALPEPPKAFAIGFEDAAAVDELSSARRAAAVIGVPLVEVQTTQAAYLAAWPGHVSGVGEPIANSSTLLVELLCRAVRSTHKVVLSGQGADEPLGGYPRHAAHLFSFLARGLSPVLPLVPERVLASDRIVRMSRIARAPDEATRFAETFAVFGVAEASGMARGCGGQGDDLVDPVRRWIPSTQANDDALNRLLQVDTRLSLADDLLIVADNMSMASSVELRVPFLDLELLGLVEAMPSRYKVSLLGGRKWLYRRSVSRILPRSLRPSLTGFRARFGRKLGFTTPLDNWFRHWSENEAEEYLLGKQARMPAFVRTEPVRGLLTAVHDQGRSRSRQLLSLYVLETWLRGALGGDGYQLQQGRA